MIGWLPAHPRDLVWCLGRLVYAVWLYGRGT